MAQYLVLKNFDAVDSLSFAFFSFHLHNLILLCIISISFNS